MIYRQGDIIDTKTYGFVTVQAPMPIEENNNPKYNLLGGRILYWVQDINGVDLFLFENELSNELTDEEKLVDSEDVETNLIDFEAGLEIATPIIKRKNK
jgi:hypothetical protein